MLRLDALSFLTHVGKDFVDAVLVDDTNALVRDAQTNEALLGFEPESLVLQIGQKATTRAVVGVRDVVTANRLFTGYLADPGHAESPLKNS